MFIIKRIKQHLEHHFVIMSRRLNKYKHHIKFLSACSPKHCSQFLKTADRELINCICECALNVLHGNVPLGDKQLTNLRKYKAQLRQLTAKGSFKKKKTIIQNGSGFLPLLLAPILTALGSSLFK